jgi:hypothetical protein
VWKRGKPCDFLPNRTQVAEAQAAVLGITPRQLAPGDGKDVLTFAGYQNTPRPPFDRACPKLDQALGEQTDKS